METEISTQISQIKEYVSHYVSELENNNILRKHCQFRCYIVGSFVDGSFDNFSDIIRLPIIFFPDAKSNKVSIIKKANSIYNTYHAAL